MTLTIRDLDSCYCGDFRHQHVNGSGACRLNDLHSIGEGRCRKFRLTETGEEYRKCNPKHAAMLLGEQSGPQS